MDKGRGERVDFLMKAKVMGGGTAVTALDKQIGGGHYKDLNIQPIEFIHANNLPYIEGCVIKYITRWRNKNGVEDLEKIKHYIDLLIDLEGDKNADDPAR